MTDTNTKRSSIGGRAPVPTPRLNQNQGPALMSIDAALGRILGAKIRIKLTNVESETVGYVVNVSTSHNTVALSPVRPGSQSSGQGSPSTAGITTIFISGVESFQLLELAPSTTAAKAAALSLPTLTNADVEKNVRAAVKQAVEEEANRGKGVSADAQQLYDALRRILPIRWLENGSGAFVLNENMLVEAPYGVENCRPTEGTSERAFGYVKKVFESERKKLADKKASSKAPTEAENKGG